MNKTNKYLNIALRCGIFVSFILACASFGMIIGSFKNLKVEGLDENNVVERILGIIPDMTGAFKVYTIVVIVLGITLVLSILTRYKARIVSLIFRPLTLLICFMTFVSGMPVANAFNKLATYSNLNITAHDKESLAASLTASGVSADDVTRISEDLSNKDNLLVVIGAYFIVPFLVFILVCTSIHCLVKSKDPNNKGESEEMQ